METPPNNSTASFFTKNRRLVFYFSVVILVVLFCKLSHSLKLLNILLPFLTAIAFMLMYAVSGLHHKKFYKPVSYLFPLYVSLSVSFGLISLIFGLHTDVFISYDKTNNGNSDNFKWMKVREILNFPLTQINSVNSPPLDTVNFSRLVKSDTTCHIIIIDKTGSVTSSGKEIDSILKSSIRSTFYVTTDKFKRAKTSDLIPPYIFSGIYNNPANSSREKVSMWYYTGESELLFMGYDTDHYTIEINDEIDNSKSNFINNYFDKVNYFKRNYHVRTQKSELDDIVNSLNSIIQLKAFKKYDSIKVSVISDFLNSSAIGNKLDFHEVEHLTELNLYCLNGFDSDNPTCSAFEIIDKATNDYSLLMPKSVVDLKSQRETSDFFKDLSLSNCKYFNHKNERSLDFFYPYKSFNTSENASALVLFTETGLKKNESKSYMLRIYDDGNKQNRFPIVYKTGSMSNELVSYAGEVTPITLFQNDTLQISLPFTNSLVNNNRIYFEASSILDNKTEAFSVNLKPRMPDTTSYYLLFCFTLFMVSTSLLLILPNYFVWNLMINDKLKVVNEKTQFLNILALSFPISLGVFWAFYFYGTLAAKDCINKYVLIIPFILLGFCLPRFFQTYRKFYNKTDRLYNFNLSGSFLKDISVFFFPKQVNDNSKSKNG